MFYFYTFKHVSRFVWKNVFQKKKKVKLKKAGKKKRKIQTVQYKVSFLLFFFFYLWGDRKKVSEINMFDVRLSFFIITCSMKQRRSRKKPRLFNKSFKTLLIKKNKIKLCKKTSQKSFCQNVHWSRAVHTDHLLQRLRPVRVSRPVEREITFITLNFSFNHVLIMFMKAFAIKQRPLFCKHN